jgi:hypothetical protein
MPRTPAERLERLTARAEIMASQIADQMAVAHELGDQVQLDWLHTLVQHLVVIRQAAMMLGREESPRVFRMPEPPDGLRAVRDDYAQEWSLMPDGNWSDGNGRTSWENLLWQNGPLTEVK